MLPSNLVEYEFSDSDSDVEESDGQEDFLGLNNADSFHVLQQQYETARRAMHFPTTQTATSEMYQLPSPSPISFEDTDQDAPPKVHPTTRTAASEMDRLPAPSPISFEDADQDAWPKEHSTTQTAATEMDLLPAPSPISFEDTDQDASPKEHSTSQKTVARTEIDLPAPSKGHPSSPSQASHLTTGKTKKYAVDFKHLPTTMKEFLKEVNLYFTKPINLQRQKPPVAESTFAKAQERLLCFLGFASEVLSLRLSPDLFIRLNVIEKYLTYLKVERRLKAYTMANHVAALIYPAKFIHAEDSPDFTDVGVIKTLRAQVACLQREGHRESASTKEDLMEKNSWLEWDEVVASLARQRERVEMARTERARAEECADLLLISLYVLVPPSRACEIRTLQILPQGSSLTSPEVAGKNLVELQEDGGVKFRFQKYKTVKTYGSDTTILKNDHELSSILVDYVKNHRAKLITEESGDFLIVNNGFGRPYSSSAFCSRLKYLFHRLTGVSLSVNGLRSSFVTHTYGRSDCSDSLKDSIAAALRHSRKQAQQTYDRRSSNQRKTLALSLCSNLARDEPTKDGADQEGSGDSTFKAGDFVGLLEEGSKAACPKVLIGRVQSLQPQGEASLLWFELCAGSRDEYVFTFDAEPWLESTEAMVAVNMTPLKKKPGVFKLRTPLRSIHEAFE